MNKENKASIVQDTRVIWNTTDAVEKSGGNVVRAKVGHAFIKAAMRKSEAIYGGEISAHHYFRDFAFCDSGMIPWLLIWQLLSEKNLPLKQLIAKRRNLFPSSGEINFAVSNSSDCLNLVQSLYANKAKEINNLDGISMAFENWRFNLRKSNTEQFVRLNVETKGDQALLRKKQKN